MLAKFRKVPDAQPKPLLTPRKPVSKEASISLDHGGRRHRDSFGSDSLISGRDGISTHVRWLISRAGVAIPNLDVRSPMSQTHSITCAARLATRTRDCCTFIDNLRVYRKTYTSCLAGTFILLCGRTCHSEMNAHKKGRSPSGTKVMTSNKTPRTPSHPKKSWG